MKRILLFLLLFFVLDVMVFAASGKEPEKIVVAPIFNFDQIFVTLRQTLMRLFFQYYHLVVGFIAVLLLLSYFQGVVEGRKMRQERERQEAVEGERKLRQQIAARERSELRATEKRLARERDLIRKYVKDEDAVTRIQDALSQEEFTKEDDEELRLAPDNDNDVIDDYEIGYNSVDRVSYNPFEEELNYGIFTEEQSREFGSRGLTYFRPDGTHEGEDPSELKQYFYEEGFFDHEDDFDSGDIRLGDLDDEDDSFEDTTTIGGSSTVEIRRDNRNRFHRGMDDEGDGDGY